LKKFIKFAGFAPAVNRAYPVRHRAHTYATTRKYAGEWPKFNNDWGKEKERGEGKKGRITKGVKPIIVIFNDSPDMPPACA
jgi:hypothetical protein